MGAQTPECYGILWDGSPEGECLRCQVQADCLDVFTLQELPKLKAKAGPNFSVEKLAMLAGVPEAAIEIALQREAREPVTPPGFAAQLVGPTSPLPHSPASSQRVDLDFAEEGSEGEEEPEEELEGEGARGLEKPAHLVIEAFPEKPGEPEETKFVKEEVMPRKRGRPRKVPPTPLLEKKGGKKESPLKHLATRTPASELPPEPKKSALEAKKGTPVVGKGRKKEPVKKPEQLPRPSRARSAKPVVDRAGDRQAYARSVAELAEIALRKKEAIPQWEWGSDHDQSRFFRERKRSRIIALLTPGMKILREWEGRIYEVLVQKDGYRFAGKKYPTLYAVRIAITGRRWTLKQTRDGKRSPGLRPTGNCGAVRWFQLEKFLEKRGVSLT